MNRRGFLTGLASSLVAAPAVVSAASLMPIRGIVMDARGAADTLTIADINRAKDWLRGWSSFAPYSPGDLVWVVDDHEVEIGLRPGALNRVPPGIYRALSGGSVGLGR